MKLVEKTNDYNNNFDFLRFFAAFIVFFGHCFILSGRSHPSFLNYFPDGVLVFFVISGFLITKSWHDNPDISQFFKKRILRIFPAFIAVIVIMAIVVGPILTTFAPRDYFSDILFFKYLKNIFLFKIHYNLPGVFASNPYPDAVNGSLWSLPVEFCMYILVAAFGFLNLFNKKYLYPVILAVCFILFSFVFTGDLADKNFIWAKGNWFFQLMAAFFIASSMYTYRDKIKLSLPLFIGFLLIYLIGQKTDYRLFIQLLTLPYLVIYFAYASIPLINKWGKHGDFSYGIYVWAFPVQQAVSFFLLDKLNIYSYIAITFAISLLCGVLSFKLIEKPALDLKRVEFRKLAKCILKIEDS